MASRRCWANLPADIIGRIGLCVPCPADRAKWLAVALRHSLQLPPQPPLMKEPVDAQRPWTELPADLAAGVARHLPCITRRVHMASMCRTWRAGALPLRREHPPELPWLLLASPGGLSFCCLMCCDGESCVVHRAAAPVDLQEARFFGSYGGRWVFLSANGAGANMMVNVVSGQRLPIPDQVIFDLQGGICDMKYLGATLSSMPDQDGCIGVALVKHHGTDNIVCWDMKGRQATNPSWQSALRQKLSIEELVDQPYTIKMDDVICYDERFWFLGTPRCHLQIWEPYRHQDGSLGFDKKWTTHYLNTPYSSRVATADTRARYLVESRGGLLLVQRRTGPKFTMYNITEFSGGMFDLECLNTLDGRFLFVGRCCSKSYEVVDYPVLKEGVFFLDDDNFYSVDQMFPCSDNGRWAEGPAHPVLDLDVIQRCFPLQASSEQSPPTWVLP